VEKILLRGIVCNRYQWGGIVDAPRTYILSLTGPLKYQHMGIGGQLFTDIVGTYPSHRSLSFLRVSHSINRQIEIIVWTFRGILQFMVDGQKINLHDNGDLVLTNAFAKACSLLISVRDLFIQRKILGWISCMQIQQNKLKFFRLHVEHFKRVESPLLFHGRLFV